jgi:hypothetical protein
VSSFSAGTTGFTPNTATTGAVTLSGTLATTNGGTGLTSFTANGVVYASSTSALATGSGITYNGTTFSTSNDASIHGLTVGQGGGSLSTNTVLGVSALANGSNTGDRSVAIGYQTLNVNTTGINTAVGYQSMITNTSGTENTAVGFLSLNKNTTGNYNSALSDQALYANTTGSNNVAVGMQSLASNTTASNNTAVGYQAGYTNTTGAQHVFLGYQAGYTQNGGTQCVYIGNTSGQSATNGTLNTFVGGGSGYLVTSGSKNTVIGGYSGNQGGLDIRTSSNYIVLSDGDGNPRLYSDNNGYIFSAGWYSLTTASSANAYIGASYAMYRSTSASKYKTNVRDLPTIDITKFRPVVYNSLCEEDDKTVDHFGFIADEVDQAGYKQLVSYGAQKEVEGFQYERMTVVLTQAVQQLLATVNAQATEIQALKTKVGV